MITRTFFLSIIILVMVFCYSGQAADNSAVLYFAFDEGKGNDVKDGSPAQNDGKVQGNVKRVKGKIGQAMGVGLAAAGGRFYLASGLWTRRGHGNGCLGRPGDRGDACAADQRPGRRRAFAGAGLERGSGRGLIEEHLRLPIWRSVSVSQNSWFVVIRSPRVGWQSGWQRSGNQTP